MSSGNQCSACGRFKPWGDLAEAEHKSLDEYGHLTEEWFLLCRDCEPRLFDQEPGEAELERRAENVGRPFWEQL